MSAEVLDVGDRSIALDKQGYLVDWNQWATDVAETMAYADDCRLTTDHWTIIDLLREYYAEFEIAPPMRALLKLIRGRLEDTSWDSRRLYKLFPQGPAKQACRYAGLPRPVSCI